MPKEITIIIDNEGNASIDLKGYHGKGCDAVLKALKGLGSFDSVKTKPEYTAKNTNLQTK